MAGEAGDGPRYLSNEKNNYAPLCQTRLFRMDAEGLIVPAGAGPLRDRDFIQAAEQRRAAARPGSSAACRPASCP